MAIRRTSPLPHQERHSRSPSPPAGKKDADVSMTNLVVKTKLQLVDLAGSECVGKYLTGSVNYIAYLVKILTHKSVAP